VLFVDDDPFVTSALERACRKHARHWEITCANGAVDALARMAEQPVDVIVSDLHMPGMDGAELLGHVAELYPGTARLVLSGYADEVVTRRAAQLAHQFLSKPTETQALILAVDQAAALQRTISNEALHKALTTCKTLPTPPALYMEIVAATRSETADLHDVAALVGRDISLSAKLLQLINSSFFGIGRRVASVEQAINLLGLIRLQALLLAEEIFRKFKGSTTLDPDTVNELWRHSFLVGETAMRISRAEGQSDDRPDQAFMAGLLHDVGVLFLAAESPDAFGSILSLTAEGMQLWQAETQILGVHHGELGGGLLSLWGLPPRIVEGVSHHHRPGECNYQGLCAVSTVHAADVLISRMQGGDGLLSGAAPLPELDEEHLGRIGVAPRLAQWESLAAATCSAEMERAK
jgi:HD-like signal output (HDOD) protein/CheY-like chemotaxis protein